VRKKEKEKSILLCKKSFAIAPFHIKTKTHPVKERRKGGAMAYSLSARREERGGKKGKKSSFCFLRVRLEEKKVSPTLIEDNQRGRAENRKGKEREHYPP